MSPPLYQRLVDTLMNEYGYDYDATPDIIEKFDLMFDPGNIELVPNGPFSENFATGGRVGMQEGGEAEEEQSYEDILADLDAAQADLSDGSVSITQESPGIEALYRQYGPQLSNQLASPIDQEGMERRYGSLLPGAAQQNQLQQQAIQQQLNQAGMGTAQFGNQGQFTGIQGQGTGIAGYQQFLNQAGTDASGASAAALAGQNAGQAGINQANTMAGLMGGQALAGQNAGAQQLANAQQQADLMSGAALAGQGAGDADFAAARGFTGPQGYEDFMSPYQQEVIDSTMSDYQQELSRQQSQLGLGAGNAFGGGRFGVAQGELGAQGARGMASTLAGLRQQGFSQANQLAGQAAQQRMGLGQAAQQQAAQNVGLFGQGLQGQQSQAGQMQNQVGQNMGLYGQAGQAALGGSQAAQQQALQNVNMFGQTGQTQAGLASLQPQLAAQQIAGLGQMGAQQQQQAQGILDTNRASNKQIAYEPYDRMGFFGDQLAKMTQGYGGQQTFSTQQQAQTSPFSQLLSGIGSIAAPALMTANAFGYGGGRQG
tara:strand:- start:42 stop:1664 length:1623 start_codon:yes stop_codon:yes gene_type:complete